MTSDRQNVLETKTDRRRVALHFEVVWSKKGKRIRWQEPLVGSERQPD